MAHRSQCSSAGDNPLDPNYLPPHYREEYRMAIDALVEENLDGYYNFLKRADTVDFLCTPEIAFVQSAVQVPHEGNFGDLQRCLPGSEVDSSSDTYWPVHSDLDVPDLDLGWPQLNRFVGPTEVTTLVNPAEHDMPSIKEQARRLIRSSQQVVAIVMDMFTDVDIFAEILDAAMRNVAVYVLLDELNAHHFVNMLSNCRVNLECIQSLRVRTVSGISYQCRSGKTLKGQMMNRFLLTDCRAVLSGNYSFMWSFEKLHRCFAHLFLGQLVSTFDEEFRILFAQSQPLTIDNLPAPMEGCGPLPERQYLTDRSASFRDSRKYATLDNPEEWPRHNFEERMDTDWKKMPYNRHESPHRAVDPQGGVDMYKHPTQQLRIGQTLNMMEGPNFKRHSYTEGRQGSYQPMQQPGIPNFESQGRPFHKSHHAPPRPGVDAVYSAYDRLRSHAYPPVDQHPEPGGSIHEMEQPENYDLVLNYLSTSNAEMDQMSDKFNPPAELSSGSSRPRRLSHGKPQAYDSALPNPPEQIQQILQASNTDRKDPALRQGLRNWRINSYLSTYDNAGDEEVPLPTTQAPDPFDETPNPSFTGEFKVPAAPRPFTSYKKSTLLEPSEKYSEDFLMLAAQSKLTPSTSESSLTEADKTDEMEQQEPKDTRPEESFRRRYNPAVQRSSRLRSSLIFSSQLEQPVSQDIRTTTGRQDEDTDKAEGTESKLPFALQVLGHRKPFEWSRFARSATIDSSLTEPTKSENVENKEGKENTTVTKPSKDDNKNTDIVTASKPIDVPLLRPSSSQCELSKIDQPLQLSESLTSLIDMSDADNRLMFFKQLAAQRKAKEASALAEAKTDKVVLKTPMDPKATTVKNEQPAQTKRPKDPLVLDSCENKQSSVSTDSEKLELKKSQTQDPRLSDEPESSLKESSSPESSSAEQPPNSSESSAAQNPVGVESSLSLSAPSESSVSSEQIQPDVGTFRKITTLPTRPLIVREPFKWNRNVRSAIFDSSIKKPLKEETVKKTEKTEDSSGVKDPENDSKAAEVAVLELAVPPFVLRPSASHGELSKTDQLVLQPQSLLGNQTVDMSDADNRLMFFKELAAKRKAEEAAAAKAAAAVSLKSDSQITTLRNEQPAVQKSNAEGTKGYSKKGEMALSKTALEKNVTKDIAHLTPTVSPTVDDDHHVQRKTMEKEKLSQNNPVPVASSENEQSRVTTDSEKMELKKLKKQASTSMPHPSQSNIASQPLKEPNMLEPSVKDSSQLPPSTIDLSELSHVTSPTKLAEQSANELESLNHDSSLKVFSSVNPSSAEQPASPTTEFKVPSTPTPTESGPVVNSSALQNTTADATSSLSQPLSTMDPSTSLESNPTDNKTIDTRKPVESLSPPLLESSKTSSQTPEEATQSSPVETVLSTDMETMKPESIGFPTVTPTALESGGAESDTSSNACESNAKLNSPQVSSETSPQEPCALPPSSKMEHPPTESSSVARESSSSTAVLPSQEDVEDKTSASLGIRLSPPCSADPTENSESLLCIVEKELVDSPKQDTADAPSEETQIEKPVSPSSALASASDGSVVIPEPETMVEPMPPLPTSEVVSPRKPSEVVSPPKPSEVVSPPKPSEVVSPPKPSEVLTLSDLEESPIPPVLESMSDNQTKPTLEVSLSQTLDQTKPTVACETTLESKPITSESYPSAPVLTGGKSTVSIPCEVEKESSTASEEAVPLSPLSKQPRAPQSRYHSSTANVISSSNLRDDTKLLLGQISANSQNRNELTKEQPVTDDDKESEADKNAQKMDIGQKDGGSKFKSRGSKKTPQEREVLLQKLQNMRKERKVYSRFEMPP